MSIIASIKKATQAKELIASTRLRSLRRVFDYPLFNRTHLLLALVGLVGSVVVISGWHYFYSTHLPPGTYVNDIYLGNLPITTSQAVITDRVGDYLRESEFVIETQFHSTTSGQVKFTATDINLQVQPQTTIEQLLLQSHQRPWWQTLWSLLDPNRYPITASAVMVYDQEQLEDKLASLTSHLIQPGKPPSLYLEGSTVGVEPGENGVGVDYPELIKQLEERWQTLSHQSVALPMSVIEQQLDERQVKVAQLRAQKLLEGQLVLEVNETTQALTKAELLDFINPRDGFNSEAVAEYMTGLATQVDKLPQDAVFEYQGNKASKFSPSSDGLQLDTKDGQAKILAGLTQLEASSSSKPITLSVITTTPHVSLEDTNNLGVRELLGTGYSTYKGSIAGRVYNVALTAGRLHGILIPPGQEFSFNNAVGEISAATGYKQAYVIQNGRTELGDGGGVCQDSTTLFRAVLDAGLPVNTWKAHSYRVGYYEQNEKPGFDATVFSPSVDFRFQNDTAGHILIEALADSAKTTLTINLYGTNDGRVVTISDYTQWGASPAPAPLYQDDPSLPPGTVKQVDWAAPGLKVKYNYSVVRDNQEIFQKTFNANYRPWQAVYLRGV